MGWTSQSRQRWTPSEQMYTLFFHEWWIDTSGPCSSQENRGHPPPQPHHERQAPSLYLSDKPPPSSIVRFASSHEQIDRYIDWSEAMRRLSAMQPCD